jgi:hypothetical protein
MADALYVLANPLVLTNIERINTMAVGARLPTIYIAREYLQAGGLMSYGPSYPALYRRIAEYFDKILRGWRALSNKGRQPQNARRRLLDPRTCCDYRISKYGVAQCLVHFGRVPASRYASQILHQRSGHDARDGGSISHSYSFNVSYGSRQTFHSVPLQGSAAQGCRADCSRSVSNNSLVLAAA